MTPATEALVERLDPTSALSRAPLPPLILADALSQIQSDSVVAVGERRIHAENLLDMAAAALRSLSDSLEGTDEDLYQAVLVAYRRGAREWARLNYPKWIDRIARDAADHIGDANSMISPPPAGEE